MKKTIIVIAVLILSMTVMVGCGKTCKVTDRVSYSLGEADGWNYRENIKEFTNGEDVYMRYKSTIIMDNTKKAKGIEMYVLFKKNNKVSIDYLGDAKLISVDNSDDGYKYNFVVQAKSQYPQEFVGTFKLRATEQTKLEFSIVYGDLVATSNDRQGVIEFSK